MKKLLLVIMLFTACLATTITAQDKVALTGRTLLGVFVGGGMVGDAVIASWSNELIDVFPGQQAITSPEQQYTFTLIPQPGACGETPLTFSAAGSSKVVMLDLPDCTVHNEPPPSMQLPLEADYRTFTNQRLGASQKYLQINQNLRNMLAQFQSLVDAAKQTTDFNQRTALADQAAALLNELKNDVPYINEKGHGTAAIGTGDLKPQVEGKFGPVDPAPFSVMIYKEFSQAQARSGGATANPVVRAFLSTQMKVPGR